MSVQAGSRGFTIFELMITVAIAAIISAFAIPGFQDLMARNRINSVAEEVASSLASARTTAVTQRRTVVLQTTTGSGGWMVYLDCTTPSATCTTSRRIESHQVLAPITITHVPVTATEVSFRPSGMVVQTLPAGGAIDLVITICDSSRSDEVGKDVSISRVGKITSRLHASASTCNP